MSSFRNAFTRWRKLDHLVEKLGYGKVALVFVAALMLGIIALRFYYTLMTGYILPDEAWYYNNFVLDKMHYAYYREVFLAVYLLFFQDVRDINTFILRGAIFSAIWALGCVVVCYGMFKRLKVGEKTIALLLLSLPLFPIFTVLVTTILTETLGLFFALLGVYFMISYMQSYRARYALLSSVAFLMAYKVREPYLIFLVGNFITMLLAEKKPIRSILAYAVPMALVFPIPVSIQPLQFAQPVYAFVINMLSQISSVAPEATPVVPEIPELLRPSISVHLEAEQVDMLKAFLVGLFYGYNPLFMIFTFIALGLVLHSLKTRRSAVATSTALNMLLALFSFVASLFIIMGTLANALSGWTSTIVRMAHTSIPVFIGYSYLYEKVKTKHMIAVLLIFLAMASTQVPQFGYTLQRSLSAEPVNRLSFDYRAPYFRLYRLAEESGRTLVLGLHLRGIRVYMSMLPNVTVARVPPREAEFEALINEGWDTIFLYDDWLTIKVPSMLNAYPAYYRQILVSRSYSGYVVETLWVDGESYAIRMVKSGAVAIEESHAFDTFSVARNPEPVIFLKNGPLGFPGEKWLDQQERSNFWK